MSGYAVSAPSVAGEIRSIASRLDAISLIPQTTRANQLGHDEKGQVVVVGSVEREELVPASDPRPILNEIDPALRRVAAAWQASSSMDPATVIALVALHDSAARVSPDWQARRAELLALLAAYLPASHRAQLPAQATGTISGQPVATATVGAFDWLQQTLTRLERALAPRQRRIERDSNDRIIRIVDEEIAGPDVHGKVVRGVGG
jgi:hypothetical protein